MLHLMAYSRSTNATADLDMTPVQDDIMLIQNAHFLPQQDVRLVAAFANGTTLARARINTPSLRQISSPFIRPINLGNLPTTLPAVADYSHNPLLLKGLEEISVLTTQTAAGPTQVNVGLLVDTGSTPIAPQGQIITLRGTGTTTAVANTWTTCPITWADTLPAGNFAIVGLQSQGATAIMSRLIVNGQVERPGVVAQTLLGDNGFDGFRKGNLGAWGFFNSTRMPLVQYLCNAADVAQEVYLDLIRIG
jgi:hypothetical protein